MNKFLFDGLVTAIAVTTAVGGVKADETECDPGGFYVGISAGISIHSTKIKIGEEKSEKYAELLKDLVGAQKAAKELGADIEKEKKAARDVYDNARVKFQEAVISKFGLNENALNAGANAVANAGDFRDATVGGSAVLFNAVPPAASVLSTLWSEAFSGAVGAGGQVNVANALNSSERRQAYQNKLRENAGILFDKLVSGYESGAATDAVYKGAYANGRFDVTIGAATISFDFAAIPTGDSKTVFYKKEANGSVSGVLEDAIKSQEREAVLAKYEPKIKEIKDAYTKVYSDNTLGKQMDDKFDADARATEIAKGEMLQYSLNKDKVVSKTGNGFIIDGIVGYHYNMGVAYVGLEVFGGYDSYKSDVKPINAATTESDNVDNHGIRVTRHCFFGATPVVSVPVSGVRVFVGGGIVVGRYIIDTSTAKYENATLKLAGSLVDSVNKVTNDNTKTETEINKMANSEDQVVATLVNTAIDEIKPNALVEDNAKFYREYSPKWKPAGYATAGVEIPVTPNLRIRVAYSCAFKKEISAIDADSKFEVKDTTHAAKLSLLYSMGG
jgi:hypothetical protein